MDCGMPSGMKEMLTLRCKILGPSSSSHPRVSRVSMYDNVVLEKHTGFCRFAMTGITTYYLRCQELHSELLTPVTIP
jgi:hypothetical protein